MAKAIKCTQCGASDVRKTGETEYTCNYCESKILINQNKTDFSQFFNQFTSKSTNYSTPAYSSYSTVNRKRVTLVILIAVVIFIGVFVASILSIVSSSNQTSTETQSKDGWKLTYTSLSYFMNGSKGPVIWLFQEENKNWNEERKRLLIINPINNKTLVDEMIQKPIKYGTSQASAWDLFQGGRVFGDTVYFSPKNKIIEARNIYTGKIVLTCSDIEKIAGMKIATAQVYQNQTDDYLRMEGADGTDFYFYPKTMKIITDDDKNKLNQNEKINKYYFALLGDRDKKTVVRVNQAIGKFDKTGYFTVSRMKDFNGNKNYYTKYYSVASIDSIPCKNYFFNAEFLSWNDTSFIIKYKEDIMEKSPVFIGCYTLRGKQLWKVNPSAQSSFTNQKTNSFPSFNYYVQNKMIIVTCNDSKKGAIGIDAMTGKITWNYKEGN